MPPTRTLLSNLLIAAIVLSLQFASKGDATLAWDPVPTAVLYTLLWGTSSGSYTEYNRCPSIETNLTATGLLPNQVYYFAVTATAADGTESAFSTEVSYTNAPGSAVPPTPGLTTQPSCVGALAGGQAQFTVVATNAQSYQWYQNGAPLVDGAEFSGSQTATLTINPVSAADVAYYSVIVANASGSSPSSVVVLTVVAAPTVTVGQALEATNGQLSTISANLGQSASFAVGVNSNAPVLYQWQLNGSDIAGATTPVLDLGAVTDADAGSYAVIVSTGGSSLTNPLPAILSVIDPPVIIAQPQSQTDADGSPVVLSVTNTGTAPAYRWYKNGVLLCDGGNISGAASATLALTPVSDADAGSYVVVLTNSAGVVTSAPPAVLSVLEPVRITVQPSSVSVNWGQTAIWGVCAIGTAPLTYQWLFNGNVIPGATGSLYFINSVVASEMGAYTAVVSNAVGAATSDPATLTVVGSP